MNLINESGNGACDQNEMDTTTLHALEFDNKHWEESD